jgi:hypothetical protein
MLLLEGPDGSGKTMLAQRLSSDFNIPVLPKAVGSDTQALIDLDHWVEFTIESGLRPEIHDRYPLISEPIYGPVLRGYLAHGFSDFGWLRTMQRALRQMRPLTIFCLPPCGVVMDNVKNDSVNELVRDKINLIYWMYYCEASTWSHMLRWDYVHDHYSDIRALVKDWLEEKGF